MRAHIQIYSEELNLWTSVNMLQKDMTGLWRHNPLCSFVHLYIAWGFSPSLFPFFYLGELSSASWLFQIYLFISKDCSKEVVSVISRYQSLKLVHVSFLHFLRIWHSAQRSLFAIHCHFSNQTLKNKMKSHRKTSLILFSVLFLCMYHRRHLLAYLTHWLNGNFFKKRKSIFWGKGNVGVCCQCSLNLMGLLKTSWSWLAMNQ